MELGRFMGSLHPALIHFPIALLFVAVLLEAVAFFRPDPRLRWAGRLLLTLGAVSTLWAFVCGNFAELWAARSGVSQEALETHELLATVTSWLFVGLTGWRLLMRDEPDGTPSRWRAAWLVAAIGACVLLGVTGRYGGGLVYERGAGVQNIGMQQQPTHEDLFQLMQRQDADSIFYSNMMHHVFGWLVLVLALLLLADYLSPALAARARKVGPLLLLAGGLFLLVFSDQDAWPLYHVHPFRPITDKEVLLHKTYAILMLLIGSRGLFTMLRRKGSRDADRWRVQDRLMAVFALVGGALLFTHIHSAAPYANVAVGVYIHHTVMGLIALLIGAVKLLDDAAVRPARWRALAYPGLMALEAVFLINYNEGLPWFLGYGRHSTIAAHGGLIAPLGPYRAELLYDPTTNRFDIALQEPDGRGPAPVSADSARLIVRNGDDPTEVPLAPNAESAANGSRFCGAAPFLKGVSTFQAQAIVALSGREYTADFEPWIDRGLAVLTHPSYACPMHPNVGGPSPGRCSECGMPLVRHLPRPAGALHDGEYTLRFRAPERVTPRQVIPLEFAVMRAGSAAPLPLEVVHTKKIHLIVASKDLSFFDHVHPVEREPGLFSLNYAFPAAGDYLLFADVMPVGAAGQVFRQEMTVGGQSHPRVPLRESTVLARLFGDYRVRLRLSPVPLQRNEETTLTFWVDEKGWPVTDLEPFLGAGGHCVILSEDGQSYLHSHPQGADGLSAYGPSVTFHAQFPAPGLYKVWGQFQHKGRPITADFVVRVP